MFINLIQYVLKGALRDRLLLSLLLLLVLGTSLSIFTGSSAAVEKIQFTQVFAAGGLRIIGIAGLVLFVVFFIRRSFDARDVEYLLSRPVGRMQFLLAYAAGFSILALMTGVAQALCLYFLDMKNFDSGAFLWSFSLIVENIIMVNTALFFAMFLSSPVSATMSVFGFYVLSRMMGQILGILTLTAQSGIMEGLAYTMQLVSVVTPRLDLMAQSSWLLYGAESGVGYGYISLQGILFSALVLSATMIDLVKRQF